MHRAFPWQLSARLAFIACALSACTSHPSTSSTGAARSIFNGIDLTDWDGDPQRWRVEGGLLTGETTAANPIARNTFIIYRGAEVEDFELEFDYVIRSDWANSGVQYRSFELPSSGPGDEGRWIVGGYQADIDEPVRYTGILYGERDRGILALRGQRVAIGSGGQPVVTGSIGDTAGLARGINGKDGWNHYRIEVTGNRVVHEINGVLMAEIIDNDAVVTEAGAKGARTRGVLALQLHTGSPMKIQFRDLTLRSTARL